MVARQRFWSINSCVDSAISTYLWDPIPERPDLMAEAIWKGRKIHLPRIVESTLPGDLLFEHAWLELLP